MYKAEAAHMVLSKPNLTLAKPKRAFVRSSSVVPGDTDKTPRKSLFAFPVAPDRLHCSLLEKIEVSSTALSCLLVALPYTLKWIWGSPKFKSLRANPSGCLR